MVVEKCCAKLATNKKSIFGLRMNTQILCLLLGACFFTVTSAGDAEISCANVRNIFEKKGILSAVDIQTQPNSDIDGICLNKGCCGPAARARLTGMARAQFDGALRAELNKLSDMLANKASRFDEFFRKLLKLSREEFHSMFKRTYGMIYEQHSYVFEQLFEELESYYTRGDTNFSTMMDRFFGILYEKMFTVLNSQYDFDAAYLKCVNENMRDIQPFEDVPNKLTMQLKRAVVATRTFHKALRAGADVVRNMVQAGITGECASSWARLQYCGACGGATAPACSRYCHNVVRGCLPAHADLAEPWDAYVEAVDKVADRLLGPFNIAMVVEPIDIKISEAIMSFQEHNREISQKIFAGCGKPVLGGAGGAGPFGAAEGRRAARAAPAFRAPPSADGDDFEIEGSPEVAPEERPRADDARRELRAFAERAELRALFLEYLRGRVPLERYRERRRARRDAAPEPAPAAPRDVDFEAYDFGGGDGPRRKKPAARPDDGHGSEWGGPALERLVKETRARMRNTKRFWGQLPALLCTPASVPSAPCFNGSRVASYVAGAAGWGAAGAASNPEVRSGAGAGALSLAAAQADTLRRAAAHLRDAYNGQEVAWTDYSERDRQAAAAGVDESVDERDGSGSGDYDGGERGPPRDDEDSDDEAGSGDEAQPPERAEPPAPEPPLEPSVVRPPPAVDVLQRARPAPAEAAPPAPPAPDAEAPAPRDAAAAGVSLQGALFSYALPVVAAWFGSVLTDLF